MNKNKKILLGLLLIMTLLIFFWVKSSKDNNNAGWQDSSTSVPIEKNYDIALGETVSDTIDNVLEYFDISESQVAIAYYDFVDGANYYLNADEAMYAASTTKVAIATLYADLINNGVMNWNTELPYYDSYYESGEGAITNEEKADFYPVDALVSEMLTHSDNTATNVLALYYIKHFSGDFGSYRQEIVALSGLDDLPDTVYEDNYATARMLEQSLLRVANDDAYSFIIETMLEAQDGFRLKVHVSEGMAAKYGSSEQWHHDMGIYYEEGAPNYAIVVMTDGIVEVDEFIGILNFYLHQI